MVIEKVMFQFSFKTNRVSGIFANFTKYKLNKCFLGPATKVMVNIFIKSIGPVSETEGVRSITS